MYTLFDIDKADFSGDYDAFEKTLLPEDSKRVGEELQAVFKARGDRYESTFRVKGQQGKIKHIKVSARCFYDSDGKIDKLIGNNWDVSNDVERTHALESSQEMLRKIIDSTPDWIFVKDIEHRYLLANRAFGEAIKMDASEFLGKNDLEIGFPEDIVKGNPETGIPGFWADDKKVFETGELIVVEDDPALVNGVMRKFHTIKAPLFDEKNQVYAVLGYSRDLTEEREKDALLEKQRASLVESTKMASLGEMSAGIAHEINNPLAVISGFARRIERTLTELPESASRAGIQDAAMRIQQHTKRIAAIVKGLRAFARDTTHDPFVNIGIRSVIEDSLGLCQEKFKVMGIDLRLVLPQVELVVSGRPAELSQVVVNLLNNARDAIAGCEQPWVQVEVQARGQDKVAVLISDSGPGVPEALQDKIMQPFFTTKPVGSGTGLGLSISHGIITSHGGTLTLARRLSASTFEIVLPAVASAAVASTEQTPHGPASPGRSEAA